MEYFQKVNTDLEANVLRSKVQIEEVEGLPETLAVLATKVPFMYLTGDNAGTTYTHEGIYSSVPYSSIIMDNGGIVYNGVDSGLFSHQVQPGKAGDYKITLHAEIKVVGTTLNIPTRVRFDLTKNNNNVGIMATALAAAGNESVDMVEGITDDNADDARFEDRFTSDFSTTIYGRTIIKTGFGLLRAVAGDVIRIRTYIWRRSFPIGTGLLDTPISIRPRILIEKIW